MSEQIKELSMQSEHLAKKLEKFSAGLNTQERALLKAMLTPGNKGGLKLGKEIRIELERVFDSVLCW